MEHPPHIAAWCAMQHAIEDGDRQAEQRHRQEWLASLRSGASRSDAQATSAAGDDQIDWGNVASEVKTMLELNPAAADRKRKNND